MVLIVFDGAVNFVMDGAGDVEMGRCLSGVSLLKHWDAVNIVVLWGAAYLTAVSGYWRCTEDSASGSRVLSVDGLLLLKSAVPNFSHVTLK